MSEGYVYALGSRWLTPLYDPFFAAFMPEKRMRAAVVERLASGESVLDLGCGTGSLAVLIKHERPLCRVVGIDGDPRILEIARQKSARRRLAVELRVADAAKLPFDAAAFDAVVSSMMFHHLPPETKRSALLECVRVLKLGGRMLLMDFGLPAGGAAAAASRFVGLMDGAETTRDNLEGTLPVLMEQAGFSPVREVWARNTVFGTVRMLEARR